MRKEAFGILANFALIACGGSADGDPKTSTMILHEDLFIGSEHAEEYALTTVVDLNRDSAGTFYVVQPMDQSVWMYDSAGAFKGKIGRRGTGPGEFAMPSTVGFLGDSVWVSDPDLNRLTVFGPDNAKSLISPRVDLSPLHFYPTRLLKDRSVFSHPSTALHLVSSGQITAVPLLRLSGEQLDTMALLPLEHKWWVMRDERRPDYGEGYAAQPFADDPLFAVSPDGDEIVVVTRLAHPDVEEFTVTKYRYNCTPIDSVRLHYTSLPVPEEQIQRAVDKLAESVGQSPLFGSVAYAAKSLRKTLYVPTHLPPVTQVVLGVDGRTWLRREETGEPSVKWWVLNSDNNVEWEFLAPRALTILYANGRSAAGFILDELDVPHIVAYSLEEDPSR